QSTAVCVRLDFSSFYYRGWCTSSTSFSYIFYSLQHLFTMDGEFHKNPPNGAFFIIYYYLYKIIVIISAVVMWISHFIIRDVRLSICGYFVYKRFVCHSYSYLHPSNSINLSSLSALL